MNQQNYKSESKVEGGQAAGLRDIKKMNELNQRYNLKNPDVALEVYESIANDPSYFETTQGKTFQRSLLRTAIRSENYLSDETRISGRGQKKAEDRIRKETKESNVRQKRTKTTTKKLAKEPKKKRINERKHHIGAWFITLLLVMIIIFGKSMYEIVVYEVQSYLSARKIEQLISCILEPVDANVSEISREDDVIANGNPKEAAESEHSHKASSTGEPHILHQYSVLYNRNHDMAGWIKIDDTIINYPVMLTKQEEEYYLKRDFDKEDDLCGLPFLDARCDVAVPVTNQIIYGHNMKNESMFSKLLNYESYEFYQEHPTIQFDTIYETGTYEIMAVLKTRVAYQDEDTFRYYGMVEPENQEEFDIYVENIKDLSIYSTGINAVYGDHLLTLSTCDRRYENGRFVVIAKKRTTKE